MCYFFRSSLDCDQSTSGTVLVRVYGTHLPAQAEVGNKSMAKQCELQIASINHKGLSSPISEIRNTTEGQKWSFIKKWVLREVTWRPKRCCFDFCSEWGEGVTYCATETLTKACSPWPFAHERSEAGTITNCCSTGTSHFTLHNQ